MVSCIQDVSITDNKTHRTVSTSVHVSLPGPHQDKLRNIQESMVDIVLCNKPSLDDVQKDVLDHERDHAPKSISAGIIHEKSNLKTPFLWSFLHR